MSDQNTSKASIVDHKNNRLSGVVTWQSPSNIAIVKYWGKFGEQLPSNPSLSLTLSEAYTETEVIYKPGTGKVTFFFEGESNEPFAPRVKKYISRLSHDFQILSLLDYEIHSHNSFPHSAGIASSASSMSALALCIGSIIHDSGVKVSDFYQLASHNARLGSGSASRSIDGPVMIWGKEDTIQGSSNEFAIKAVDVHPVYETMQDTILLVDKNEKEVKSSAGHSLMNNHPYAEQRFRRARTHLRELLAVLKSGDVEGFGKIAEAEAFDLHGMMMASKPPYLLIKPNTVSVINALHEFRADTKLPVFMTLDAGPNVHLLYPEEIIAQVAPWIESELKPLCADGQMIHDKVGLGPKRVQ